MFASVHNSRSSSDPSIRDFLPYLDPDWNPSPTVDASRYDAVSQSILKALGAKLQ